MVRVKPLVMAQKKEIDITETAKAILEKLLVLMGVAGFVSLQTQPIIEPGKETTATTVLNVEGDDPGILIGRRGQTLSSLQYIVRLIVGRQTKVWVPMIIDVEGYKQRRYQALQALARQLAEQVKAGGKPFTLEPMPPYERRIVHLALADHPDVITESIGEGEARKVVIMPKKQ